MRAVLLASGQSSRFAPLENKMALPFCGQPLMAWQVQQLLNHGFDELFVIYGQHNEVELREIASEWPIKLIKFVEQENLADGMAGAMESLAKAYPDNEGFLLISTNDIVADTALTDLAKSIKTDPTQSLILAQQLPEGEYFPGGYLEVEADHRISKIVEKPGAGNQPSDLINLVYHYHAEPSKLWAALKQVKAHPDEHYERALQQMFDQGQSYFAVNYRGPWQALKYPWHVLDMARLIFERLTPQISSQAEVHPSAIIQGQVHLEAGVKVLANAVIVGPSYIGENTIVANGALVRDSYIGPDCVIGYNTEVARSYLKGEVWTHTNYIGDSIIGQNVSFGAGTITGNLRLDEGEITVTIKGEKIMTGRQKLGLITGDNIRVGINTSLMPGVKLGSNSMIGAHLMIAEDIPANSYVVGEKPVLSIKENKSSIKKRD